MVRARRFQARHRGVRDRARRDREVRVECARREHDEGVLCVRVDGGDQRPRVVEIRSFELRLVRRVAEQVVDADFARDLEALLVGVDDEHSLAALMQLAHDLATDAPQPAYHDVIAHPARSPAAAAHAERLGDAARDHALHDSPGCVEQHADPGADVEHREHAPAPVERLDLLVPDRGERDH